MKIKTIVILALTFAVVHQAHAGVPPEGVDLEAAQAYQVIAATDVYTPGPVGIAAEIPDTVKALRTLLRSPNATEAFVSLLSEASLAGQLIALDGLYFADRAKFTELARTYEDVSTRVPSRFGCIGVARPFNELVASISNGANAMILESLVRE